MLPAGYLEPIILVFHCLWLDNWRVVVVAVNLRIFLGSLVYKEQYYMQQTLAYSIAINFIMS